MGVNPKVNPERPRAGKRALSDMEEAQVYVNVVNEGKSVEEEAVRLGVTVRTVYNALRRERERIAPPGSGAGRHTTEGRCADDTQNTKEVA